MLRVILAATLLNFFVGTARSDETPPPKSLQPTSGEASVDSDGFIVLEQTVQKLVTEPVAEMVASAGGGMHVEMSIRTHPKTVTERTRLDASTLQAMDKNGNKIDLKDLRSLLKNPTTVLISADGQTVDPAYLKEAKEGTIILIVPKSGTAVAPPKSEPAPVVPMPAPAVVPPKSEPVVTDEAQIEQDIKALGGRLSRYNDPQGNPSVSAWLADRNVTDETLKEIAGLKDLVALYLDNTKVTDAGMPELAKLKRLISLHLSRTQITDASVKYFACHKSMQWLDLMDTKITDEGLKELADLNKLTYLNLVNTKVTDAGLQNLAGLTKMHTLELIGTQVTDAGLKSLVKLQDMAILTLPMVGVTPQGVAELQKSLPNCRILQKTHF